MVRIRGPQASYEPLSMDKALRAIKTVEQLLPLLSIGVPIVHREPGGLVHVDLPLVYNGVALDRIHYDPVSGSFSPKGRPVRAVVDELDLDEVVKASTRLLGEVRVVDAVEYREPERCWVVPVAWRSYIVAHICVDVEGEEIVPDYGLTAEMNRRAFR